MINRNLFGSPNQGEYPFERARIEHGKLDWVLIDKITGKALGRPLLTIMFDTYSRSVLGFYVNVDQPSTPHLMMVIRECVRRFNMLPNAIVMDNGHESNPALFKSLIEQYGLTLIRQSPHKARFTTVVEQFFKTLTPQIIQKLESNTKTSKNVPQETDFGYQHYRVLDLPDLNEMLREFFYEIYDTSVISELDGSPRDVLERGFERHGLSRTIPYDNNFIIMTLPSVNGDIVKVHQQRGVMINEICYYCDEFNNPDIAGTQVPVRYDPLNAGIVYCFVLGQWVKCDSL